MKKTLLTFLLVGLFVGAMAQQSKSTSPPLKGNGEVFFLETFDWGNPDDPRGWSLPEGYSMEDPDDIGFNWHWWPYDSLVTPRLTREPPMESTTAADGSLCLFADLYNLDQDPRININNSIVFPPIDCSGHSSVIVRYETCFMNYASAWDMLLEVSVDDWVHSAQWDVGFGCGHKGRPDKTVPGKPAIFEANLSQIAAGMPNVQFKLTWRGTSLYWWQVDDFQLSEAWDNDMQLKFAEMEWDDGDENTFVTPSFMFPKSQIADGSLTNFRGSAINFGEFDLEGVYYEVDITKNNQSIYKQTTDPKYLFSLDIDTSLIESAYAPVEFGHYKVTHNYKQSVEDDTPFNNMKETFFDITDSVYSRADGSSEEAFCWGMEAYGPDGEPNIGHVVATTYPIYANCEVNSISAYIAGGKGDGMIDFRYVLYLRPDPEEEIQDPIEWIVTEYVDYDSSMIDTWVTLPLEKDGESEFLLAGDVVYAGIEYNNMNTDLISHRYDNFKVGADYNSKLLDPVSIARNGALAWSYGGYVAERQLMIRLNLNDNSNIIDGTGFIESIGSLSQNYPNPFSSSTQIEYELTKNAEVIIEIADLTGRIVMTIEEGQRGPGKYLYSLNADLLDAGVYFYTLKAGEFKEQKKMIVQ
jgi:hypothetical protein